MLFSRILKKMNKRILSLERHISAFTGLIILVFVCSPALPDSSGLGVTYEQVMKNIKEVFPGAPDTGRTVKGMDRWAFLSNPYQAVMIMTGRNNDIMDVSIQIDANTLLQKPQYLWTVLGQVALNAMPDLGSLDKATELATRAFYVALRDFERGHESEENSFKLLIRNRLITADIIFGQYLMFSIEVPD